MKGYYSALTGKYYSTESARDKAEKKERKRRSKDSKTHGDDNF